MICRLLVLAFLTKLIWAGKAKLCGDTNSFKEEYILSNYLPKGYREHKIDFIKTLKLFSVRRCVVDCCKSKNCDAIIMTKGKCYLTHCPNIYDCEPVKGTNKSQHYYFTLRDPQDSSLTDRKEPRRNEVEVNCESNEDCPEDELCNQEENGSRPAVCICRDGYIRKGKRCIKDKVGMTTTVSSSKNSTIRVPSRFPLGQPKKVSSTSKFNNTTISRKIPPMKYVNYMKNYTLSADAGLDMTVKVSKSSLIDKPEIISIYGLGKVVEERAVAKTKSLVYSWQRLPESLAAGSVVNNSDHEPTLKMTNLVQGQYLFELTVTSEDGIMAKDSVKLVVVEATNDIERNLVNIIFSADIHQFSEKDKNQFSKRMAHIIEKDLSYRKCVVEVHSVSPKKNNTVITFHAKMYNNRSEFETISSQLLEIKLKRKVLDHKFIFDYPVTAFQSQICYNDCGGHGFCDNVSHQCICSFPWLNNALRERSLGFSNCDMHVMIIVVSCSVGFFVLVMLFICLKKIIKIIRSRSGYRKKILKYRLLENSET